MTDEESVEIGDLRFTAWDVGPCESESETVAAGNEPVLRRSNGLSGYARYAAPRLVGLAAGRVGRSPVRPMRFAL